MDFNQLETPMVLIYEEIMEDNMLRVQQFCDRMGYNFRPHIKTHKVPDIAKRQIARGAVGITCQKLGEAEVMADAGIDDILIYYNVFGDAKMKRLSQLSQRVKLSLAIDNLYVAEGISHALETHGGQVRVLIDCNTGYNRTGVATPEQALELSQAILNLPKLSFTGLATFPYMSQSTEWFLRAMELFEHAGIPVDTISVGGSGFPTFSQERIPFVTEYRAGTSVFNDRTCVMSGWATLEQCAERVLTTVVSVPNENMVILDAGSKTLTSDTRSGMAGYGHIMEYPDAVIVQLSEEHGHVDVSQCVKNPVLGELLTVIPNHACGTMNLHDWVLRVRGAGGGHEMSSGEPRREVREDEAASEGDGDKWVVAARGKIR